MKTRFHIFYSSDSEKYFVLFVFLLDLLDTLDGLAAAEQLDVTTLPDMNTSRVPFWDLPLVPREEPRVPRDVPRDPPRALPRAPRVLPRDPPRDPRPRARVAGLLSPSSRSGSESRSESRSSHCRERRVEQRKLRLNTIILIYLTCFVWRKHRW